MASGGMIGLRGRLNCQLHNGHQKFFPSILSHRETCALHEYVHYGNIHPYRWEILILVIIDTWEILILESIDTWEILILESIDTWEILILEVYLEKNQCSKNIHT